MTDTTRDRLTVLVHAHPAWTIARYARALDLSAGRVHQLLHLIGARKVWILPDGPAVEEGR